MTATEVRIALSPGQGAKRDSDQPWASEPGPIPTEPSGDESEDARSSRAMQEYFNRNFQFYGRTLRYYATTGDGTPVGQRQAAIQADQQHRVFAGQCPRS